MEALPTMHTQHDILICDIYNVVTLMAEKKSHFLWMGDHKRISKQLLLELGGHGLTPAKLKSMCDCFHVCRGGRKMVNITSV